MRMFFYWSYQPTYAKNVPVLVGSQIIDRAMKVIMKGELARATLT